LINAFIAPPWGVQAVLSLVPYQLPPGFAGRLHVEAVRFAACSLAHVSAMEALSAMRDAYDEVLRSLYPAVFAVAVEEQQQGGFQQQQQQQQQYGGGGGGGDVNINGGGVKRKWEEGQQQQQQQQGHNVPLQMHPVNVPPGSMNNAGGGGGAGNAARLAKEAVYEQALLQSASADGFSDDSDF
jgi:hypothetical protein